MSLIYGYEVRKPPRQMTTVGHTLHYAALRLNSASYPINTTSRGYRYASMTGFDRDTNITMVAHMFGTNVGKDVLECVIKYSMELILNDGSFEYHDIDTIDLKDLKLPKTGQRYNIFLLNKKFNVYEKIGHRDLRLFSALSIYVTLSGDTSTLDIEVEVGNK